MMPSSASRRSSAIEEATYMGQILTRDKRRARIQKGVGESLSLNPTLDDSFFVKLV